MDLCENFPQFEHYLRLPDGFSRHFHISSAEVAMKGISRGVEDHFLVVIYLDVCGEFFPDRENRPLPPTMD